ncbi:MAG: hypothetical protein HHJ15_18215 [Rhodoferax sp.]|uniref:hypothetical protein n=1 Tax=Rhodoferax sp. TaxID=50421 RepID=UPI0017F71D01|nr:hypothetical protein [Rhodoferax sp.]NMM21858.1 hypothetical protein [Rhodoferax sp.]
MTDQKHDMPKIDMDTQKDVVKEALREWLDDAFATFGRWTFMGLLAAAFAGAVYLALKGQGWSK